MDLGKKKLDYFTNILGYLIILLPIFLISGPLLPDLAVSIVAIFSLFIMRDKKFFYIIFLLFLLFFGV